jgi:hypothetical protein
MGRAYNGPSEDVMGLFGLFGADKPTPANIQKLVGRLREGYAQPEYRREAMEKLLAWGTPESLEGVCRRFAVVAQSPHWDEEEKRWLCDELAERGEPAREAIKRFLAKENAIAHASRALEKLESKERYTQDLVEALTARPPEDHRSTQGKVELIAALGATQDPRVVEAILPYLDDHSDDVQCQAMDVLEQFAAVDAGKAALQRAVALVSDDARSARVLRHAAGLVARLHLPIDATKPLAPAVAEDYVVKDGTLASNR